MVLPFRPHASPGVIQALGERVLAAYEAHLNDQGCSPGLFHRSTATARHMLAWLTINESEVATLDIRGVYRFLRHDCHCPADVRNQSAATSPWHAYRFLGYLLETGQAAAPAAIVTGGGLVEALAATLVAQGYREATVRGVRSACRHLVVWLYRSELALGEIEDRVLQRFLDHRCDCVHPGFFGRSGRSGAFAGSRRTQAELARFASFLIDRDVVADCRGPLPNASGGIHTDAFLRWLRQHRGVRDTTLKAYRQSLQALLPLLGDAPGAYDAASIRAVILGRAQSGSRNTAEGSALRSYLRFLAAQGLCRPGLVAAVPTIPRRSASQLPRYVEQEDIEALIASCDTATSIGLRDRAVLLLLARLALRPGEVAALRLDDIDWQQALVALSGKSRRSAALPLPQETGDALKDYLLRARPRTACPTVFPQFRAPHGCLSGVAVSAIVRRAMKRAGVDGAGLPAAYLFRHSRATHLLRGGAAPEAVGALLRHQSVKTTALYARVDAPMLLTVAQPWPEEPR